MQRKKRTRGVNPVYTNCFAKPIVETSVKTGVKSNRIRNMWKHIGMVTTSA